MKFFLATNEAIPGLKDGIECAKAGRSAIDIVEAMIMPVERDANIHSVGFGGWPNMQGALELDAAIMNGTTFEAGAVGGLQRIMHPISVARKIMEHLPHVMLIGAGAARFAEEMGFPKEEMLSEDARTGWKKWIHTYAEQRDMQHADLADLAWKAVDPQTTGGTVVCLAHDAKNMIGAGVSTSGLAWKYPGRLGDSPVIGAGIYADSRYGAAGCIGHGELAIRTSAARTVVSYLQQGYGTRDACLAVANEILRITQRYTAAITVHGIDIRGDHAAVCIGDGVKDYYVWHEGDDNAEQVSALIME
ncbi:MAG: asparaginase [bacterium]|nr:asparaginase [bacterium]